MGADGSLKRLHELIERWYNVRHDGAWQKRFGRNFAGNAGSTCLRTGGASWDRHPIYHRQRDPSSASPARGCRRKRPASMLLNFFLRHSPRFWKWNSCSAFCPIVASPPARDEQDTFRIRRSCATGDVPRKQHVSPFLPDLVCGPAVSHRAHKLAAKATPRRSPSLCGGCRQ